MLPSSPWRRAWKLPWPNAVDRLETRVTDDKARSNAAGFFPFAELSYVMRSDAIARLPWKAKQEPIIDVNSNDIIVWSKAYRRAQLFRSRQENLCVFYFLIVSRPTTRRRSFFTVSMWLHRKRHASSVFFLWQSAMSCACSIAAASIAALFDNWTRV